ncbi:MULTISPECIES: GFA family protein [Sinorhizobium]|uniref:GFA family protein n=1 Tax=Sinorhizobium TaxID=28105 RepID=UPI000BE7C1D3|nr:MULTISPECIES: GFA family protein [Sinorhizobium]PDT53552.1 aldehyde-activating protein [Sinorhizobium sp. NG07B]POH29717.1 aldehyde-activating protein [Sinorhizobium americanum]
MTDQSVRMLAGRCLCGAVHYVVADEFRYAANCHCADCRRATGSAFKPFAGIEREKFTVTKGADHLQTYGEENAHNARCGKCGSFLYSVVRDGAYVHVALGPLADEPAIRPSEHIFVGSKAPWYTINDELPQYWAHVADGTPINC